MAFTIPLTPSPAAVKPRSVAGSVPLYIYAVALASLLTVVGVLWDISWHRTIGRDKFLSPPHILIYLGAIFAGLFSGVQVLYNSFFRKAVSQATAIRVWGIFYSSLGSLFCIWGAIAMLTSAPFDNWWHSAYGLDVKILSPPHTLLALGIFTVQLGAQLLALAHMNRASGDARRRLTAVFLFLGTTGVILLETFVMEYTSRSAMHTAQFYMVQVVLLMLLWTSLARASGERFALTMVASGYTIFILALIWILPLFHAEPKLGPVYHAVDCFIPPQFPVLL